MHAAKHGLFIPNMKKSNPVGKMKPVGRVSNQGYPKTSKTQVYLLKMIMFDDLSDLPP